MKVAIIPARGGTKRIPKKNIKNFCGKPIIGWTIHTLKKSRIFYYMANCFQIQFECQRVIQ